MKPSEVTTTWLLPQLQDVEGGDGHWVSWCPCHDDYGSSHKGLSITAPNWPKDKPVLCKCHSPQCGATLIQILASLNGQSENGHARVRVRKVQRSRAHGMQWWVEKTEIPEETWEALGCTEEGGGVAFLFEGEQIRKVRANEKEYRWVPAKGVTPSLWPYPEEELPEHIWITEGESDCGTARFAGYHAYAATKGAQTPLSIVEFQALASRGVQEVTICTDRGGEVFAAHLAKAATDAFLRVNIVDFTRVIDPFSGIKDLNDVWKEVDDLDQLRDIVDRATYQVEEQTPLSTHAQGFEMAREEKEWIISELISPGDKVLIAGPPKSYKTWLGLDLAKSMIHPGHPFLNRPEWVAKRALRVLLVEEESSRHAFSQRLARIEQSENLFFTHKMGITFTDPTTISSLIHTCKRHEIDVIFFDPLQRMIPGVNENDSTETAVVWNEIYRMQMAMPHLVVVVIHHANKSERLTQESVRGSSRHVGEADLWILIEKFDKAAIRVTMDGRDTYTDLGPGEALQGRVDIRDDSFTIDTQEFAVRVKQTKADNNRSDVLKAIQEGCDTRTKMMRYTGLSDNTVIKHLQGLIEEGLVSETKTEEGKPNVYSAT